MGGYAERWFPYPCPKELLPFGIDANGRPRVIADHVIERMMAANVEQVILPIRAEKAFLVMKYIGHCLPNGVPVIYLAAPGPTLLANLQACVPYIRGQRVLFGMPDTFFSPGTAFLDCLNLLHDPFNLVLGCFYHKHPDGLDLIDRDGDVLLAVRPKPRPATENGNDAWGIAVWGPEFTERLIEWRSDEGSTPGFVFNAAARAGQAACVQFVDGFYEDLADYSTYQKALARMDG